MHTIERLIAVINRAPLVRSPEFAYRVIAERWRDSPLSAIGAFERGGRYNAPRTFPILYSADTPVTAMQEAESLFLTSDGNLMGVPRDPEIILTIECTLMRVLDLTTPELYLELGTTREELISVKPSRFIVNARNEETSTQQLGSACFRSRGVSALKVPSAQNLDGYCLDIFIESLVVGERVAVLDTSGRMKAEIEGKFRDERTIPK